MLLLSLSLLSLVASALGEESDFDLYECSFCRAAFDFSLETGVGLKDSCSSLFGTDICKAYSEDLVIPEELASGVHARTFCERNFFCESTSHEKWQYFKHSESDSLDFRVSKGYGSRGYDKVRLSVISNRSIESEHFTYSERFKYRWTDYYLNTGIVTVTPGTKSSYTIASETIDITIPEKGEGVRGVIIGDPCFTSEWIVCAYAKKFDMFNHSISLLNAMNAHDDINFWSVLGDNFYDQAGEATASWFAALSKATKSKVMSTIPGNHDFWVNASPKLWVKKDQQGNGFMQWYGQDVASSVAASDNSPLDFSVDPDVNPDAENLPPASNFFQYNMLGNMAFISYSGAHSSAATNAYFDEACAWAADPTVNPDVVLLMGHWNGDGDGCDSDMTVPAVYASLANRPACQPIMNKMRYMVGHKHCNLIMEQDVGFMVGAVGMFDYSCEGEFGLPVVDSTGGEFNLHYFKVQDASGTDNYQTLMDCFQVNGVSGCYELAETWTSVPLAK